MNEHNDVDWLKQKYISENLTSREISNLCGANFRTVERRLEKYNIRKKELSEKIIETKLQAHVPIKNFNIEKIINESKLTETQLLEVIQTIKMGHPQKECKHVDISEEYLTFGVLSDLHIGHKNYMPKILEHAIKYFDARKVNFVCIPGDIIEGISGREGHVFELSHLGASEQLDYAVEQLSKIKQKIYAITATNSHDGWLNSKNNMGFAVGPELERRIKNFEFLGYDEADIETNTGINIRMTHPGDGTAYAISYKGQRYLNSLSGGKKPHIVLEGHYHKSMYMFYRNVHFFDCGTLQAQTVFMKKKQTPAMMGYWIIETKGNKGVDFIKPEFIPFYE